jgi:hypothetical protein
VRNRNQSKRSSEETAEKDSKVWYHKGAKKKVFLEKTLNMGVSEDVSPGR